MANEVIAEKNRNNEQWRLPTAAELRKVWSDNGFYEVELPNEPILLRSGDLLDPKSLKIIKGGPRKGGELFLIRDVL